jgi:hypothetical protein
MPTLEKLPQKTVIKRISQICSCALAKKAKTPSPNQPTKAEKASAAGAYYRCPARLCAHSEDVDPTCGNGGETSPGSDQIPVQCTQVKHWVKQCMRQQHARNSACR